MALAKALVLKTRKSFNNWVPVAEGIEFYIDYLKAQHKERMQELVVELSHLKPEVRHYKLAKYYIRCVVKDFKGVKDSEGNDVKIILEDDVWQFEQSWELFLENVTSAMAVFEILASELKFDEDEKKN